MFTPWRRWICFVCRCRRMVRHVTVKNDNKYNVKGFLFFKIYEFQSMTSDDTDENDRPITPPQEDCCGNSCNPCIFDIHRKLVDDWEKKKSKVTDTTLVKNYLSFTKYNRFIVKDIIVSESEDCIVIKVEFTPEQKDEAILLSPGQHVMIKLTNTSKPYTPIRWSNKSMDFLIKVYPDGIASNCIKELKTSDELYIRGPYGDFKYQPNSYKNVILLSIGSGIAATYPVAESIVKDELEDTRVDMICGFRSISHVPLKNELRLLTDYWNFKCTLFLSQQSGGNLTGVDIINSRLNEKMVDEILSVYSLDSSLILICGTSEFNDSFEKMFKEKKICHYYVFR